MQPTIEDLKKTHISVKYVVADTPPDKGLKRLQYYTSLPDRPGKNYFGLSFRKEEDNERINRMLENGTLVLLSPPVQLPYEKDLFINEFGQVVLANGAAPWEDNNRRIVSSPRKLSKASQLIDKQLRIVGLPKISEIHIIDNI